MRMLPPQILIQHQFKHLLIQYQLLNYQFIQQFQLHTQHHLLHLHTHQDQTILLLPQQDTHREDIQTHTKQIITLHLQIMDLPLQILQTTIQADQTEHIMMHLQNAEWYLQFTSLSEIDGRYEITDKKF